MNAPDTHFDATAARERSTPIRSAGCAATRTAAVHGAADWLCLAATPTFAIMALITGILGGGMPDMLCSSMQDASPLGGMVTMYLLMSLFHAVPWFRLLRAGS